MLPEIEIHNFQLSTFNLQLFKDGEYYLRFRSLPAARCNVFTRDARF